MGHALRVVRLIAGMSWLYAVPTIAQVPVFSCPVDFSLSGTVCQASVSQTPAIQSRVIALRAVPPGTTPTEAITVKFKASSGTVHPESTITDSQGLVRTTWFRSRAADTVAISVDLASAQGKAVGILLLTPDPTELISVRLEPRFGNNQSWFTGSMLRDPATFELRRVTADGSVSIEDERSCASHRVSFSATGAAGTIAPDTVIPSVQTRRSVRGCYASVYWTLGAGPGPRRIRATLIPAAGFKPETRFSEARAMSRSLPKLVGGLALVQRREYLGLKQGSQQTVRVERTRPDGKIAFDSVVSGATSVDSIHNSLAAVAVFAGLTGPIVPGWDRLSFTAGVDLGSPRDRWYAGLSILRLIDRATESFNFDVHLVLHWSKDAVLVDPVACAAGTNCKTEKDTRFQGAGLLATLDAGSILADLIKKLVP